MFKPTIIYLFSHFCLYQYGLKNVYFGFSSNTTLFCCSNYYSLTSVFFWHAAIFLFFFGERGCSFSFFGTIRCSGLVLYLPWSSPRIIYVSKELWFLLSKNDVRNKFWALVCSLLLRCHSSSPSQLAELEHITCVY